MSFNLLTTAWIEVRRRSGARDLIAPPAITDGIDRDPIVGLDFPRPDWNAAVCEYLVGLACLALPVETAEAWSQHFSNPPSPEALAARWKRFVQAFNFDSPGACAFQDLDTLANQAEKPVDALLIDAPGENALRNNADLFVKRERYPALSLSYAAAALITLQTYAPSGGTGHRTSLRGGGPLTTLLAPLRAGRHEPNLWDLVWANVPYSQPGDSAAMDQIFPWLSQTQTSVADRFVAPGGQPQALAFFACPRRIRLKFAEGTCAISGRYGRVCTRFRTQNYGANYLKWRHPLSPYYEDKKLGYLPVHPHSGVFHYGDWLVCQGVTGRPSLGVANWPARRRAVRNLLDKQTPEHIDAAGYDMDNMKARQWVTARIPYLAHTPASVPLIRQFAAAADEAGRALKLACRLALFGQKAGDTYLIPNSLSPEIPREPGEQLRALTETRFVDLLDTLLRTEGGEAPTGLREDWCRVLRRAANAIFNDCVDLDGLTAIDVRRLLFARETLNSQFVKVEMALALTPHLAPAEDEII